MYYFSRGFLCRLYPCILVYDINIYFINIYLYFLSMVNYLAYYVDERKNRIVYEKFVQNMNMIKNRHLHVKIADACFSIKCWN